MGRDVFSAYFGVYWIVRIVRLSGLNGCGSM